MYDIDRIKEISIVDLLKDYNIDMQKKGKNFWAKIRPEKTSSCCIYPHTNSWYDYGSHTGGDVISLTAYLENTDNGKAIQLLGERFNIEKLDNSNDEFNMLPTKKEFEKINIIADRVMSNWDNSIENNSMEELERRSERYEISIYQLSKSEPDTYHGLLDKVAYDIHNKRELFDEICVKFHLQTNPLDRAMYENLLIELSSEINEKISIFNKARLDNINLNEFKVDIPDTPKLDNIDVNDSIYKDFRKALLNEIKSNVLRLEIKDLCYQRTLDLYKLVELKSSQVVNEEAIKNLEFKLETDLKTINSKNNIYSLKKNDYEEELNMNSTEKYEFTMPYVMRDGTRIESGTTFTIEGFKEYASKFELEPEYLVRFDNFPDKTYPLDLNELSSFTKQANKNIIINNDNIKYVNEFATTLDIKKLDGTFIAKGTSFTITGYQDEQYSVKFEDTSGNTDKGNICFNIHEINSISKPLVYDPEMLTSLTNEDSTDTFRYYITNKPSNTIDIDSYPPNETNLVIFDNEQEFDDILECYGYVEYNQPLTEKQVSDYKLTPSLDVYQYLGGSILDIDDFIEDEKSPLIDFKIDKDTDIDEILEGLKNGVGNIFENERFVEYLNYQAKFHQYSFNNNILISIQNPNATEVGSFTHWKSLGRHVNKGEKGLVILAPNVKKVGAKEIMYKLDKDSSVNVGKFRLTKEDNNYNIFSSGKLFKSNLSRNELESFLKVNSINAKMITGFRKAYVFDISQTSGREVPSYKLNKLNDTRLLDDNGNYKNPIVKITSSQNHLFKENQLLSLKQMSQAIERSKLDFADMKKHSTENNLPVQDGKITFEIQLSPNPEDKILKEINFANENNIDILDFTDNSDRIKAFQETISSQNNDMELVLGINNQINRLITSKNIDLEYIPNTGSASGYYRPSENKICINSNLPLSQSTKTLIHEYVHSQLHKDGYKGVTEKDSLDSRQVAEIEAESTAYVVSKHFGFDTSDYSFEYVSGWAEGKEMATLTETLSTIKSTSEEIINSIKSPLELELYNNKETILDILKNDNIKPNDAIIYGMININEKTGKINNTADLKNFEKFKTYGSDKDLSKSISDLNKEISSNTIKIEKTIEIER